MNVAITVFNNHSLTNKHTLKIIAKARFYTEVSSLYQLAEALSFARKHCVPVIPLGAGSNIVFGGYVGALVICIHLTGKKVVSKTAKEIIVEASAGENWHQFVLWAISQKAYGLENLTLIPGTVGAAPIQNIGAYGVELENTLISLEAMHIKTQVMQTFSALDCQLGYRDSIFKHQNTWIITSVCFRLSAKINPKLDYGSLKDCVFVDKISLSNSQAMANRISETIANIRRSKLPDPKLLANAGSFFKNPIISHVHTAKLRQCYHSIPVYPYKNNQSKVSAAWLIEAVGMKGFRKGHLGIYQQHALIVVNYGGATADEVHQFAMCIIQKIKDQFEIVLEIEPKLHINLTR